jgi:hypothetical protein
VADPSLEELLAANDAPDMAAAEAPSSPAAPTPAAEPSLEELMALNEAPDEVAVPAEPVPSGPVLDRQGRAYVRDEYGDLAGTVDQAALQSLPAGYSPAAPEQVQSAVDKAEYGDVGSQVAAGAEGLAQGATLGAYGAVADAVAGPEYEAQRKLREQYNPVTSMAANVGGAILPTLLTGGEGGVATAARLMPAAIVERAGAGAAKGVAKYFGGTATARVLGMGAGGALEGGVGNAAMSASAGDDPVEVLKSFGKGALAGGGLGLALGGAIEGVSKVGQKLDAFHAQKQAAQASAEIDALHALDTVPPETAAEALAAHPGDELLGDHVLTQLDAEISPVVRTLDDHAAYLANKTVKDIGESLPKLDGGNVQGHVDSLTEASSVTARERLAANPIDKMQAMRAARGELDPELDDIAREVERRRNRMYDIQDKIDADDNVSAKLEQVARLSQGEMSMTGDAIASQVAQLKQSVTDMMNQFGEAALSQDGGTAALKRIGMTVEDLSPRIAKALFDGDLGAAYGMLDRMKRTTQKVAKRTRNREVMLHLRDQAEQFRSFLEDPSWGPVGQLQKQFNAPFSNRFLKGGDSDLGGLTKAESGERAIDPFNTVERVNGKGMRGLLEGLGDQASETQEKAWRASLAADAKDMVTRSQLVGSDANQALGREAAEHAIAIDALSTRFAEINTAKPVGARLAKLDADAAAIAAAEQKEAAREALRDTKEAAKQAKQDAREQAIADREAARDIKAADAEAAKKLSEKEDAISTIGAAFGAAIGGYPGAAVGFAVGKLPKILRSAKTLMSGVDVKYNEHLDAAVTKMIGAAKSGARKAEKVGRALPLASSVAFTPKRFADAIQNATELEDPASGPAKALQRTASQLEFVKPGLGLAYSQVQVARAHFIASKLPAPLAKTLYGQQPTMDPITERKVQRYVAAAYEPTKALTRLAEGKGNTQDLETIKTLYPQMYADFTARVTKALSESKKRPTYEERAKLAYFTGVVTEPSTDPQNAAKLQAVAAGVGQDAKEAVQGNAPNPGKDYKGPKDVNSVYASRADSITDED